LLSYDLQTKNPSSQLIHVLAHLITNEDQPSKDEPKLQSR